MVFINSVKDIKSKKMYFGIPPLILTNRNFYYIVISGGAKMSEWDLDSNINDYIETEPPKNYVKQQNGIWL